MPDPELAFSLVAVDREGHMTVFYQRVGPGPAFLALNDLEVEVGSYVVRASHEVRDGVGTATVEGRCDPITFGSGEALASVRFHVVNFPAYRGDAVSAHRAGRRASWVGRVQGDVGEWTVKLDSCEWNDKLGKEAGAQHGYAITHVGEITRSDGATFAAGDAGDLLDVLFHVLAFCRGGWSPPLLLVGNDSSGRVAWQSWRVPKCHPFRTKWTWWPRNHPEAVFSVMAAAEDRWQDLSWRHALTIAWNFYVEATQALSNETALVLGQAGIDLLRARAGFGGKGAGEKIADFLRARSIPTGVPRSLERLAMYADVNGCPNGPTAMAHVRNAVVHADAPSVFFSRDWPSTDARRLATWYLELLLLTELGYNGKYENQLDDRRSSDDVDDVPWAQNASGELERNVGNSQS